MPSSSPTKTAASRLSIRPVSQPYPELVAVAEQNSTSGIMEALFMSQSSSRSIGAEANKANHVDVMDSSHCSNFVNKFIPISRRIIEDLNSDKDFIRKLSSEHYSIMALAKLVLEFVCDLLDINKEYLVGLRAL
ncbi:hypothetical protein RJ640_028612 [Escallonia rubra]|uniref:Uncharacterized protein n=1 Tax=Escallonia rubra TaxID=112253 RepID=A0AA88R8Z2_9ASTE|nr:hypothetical protein RJ640_028612 [Escallonia rubra]